MKGLIFSPAMVKAYRGGIKIETRRVVKGLDFFGEAVGIVYVGEGEESHSGPGWYAYDTDYPDEGTLFLECPHGKVGDRVYIKEALVALDVGFGQGAKTVAYYETNMQRVLVGGEPLIWRWKPRRLSGMYMPQKASRAKPRITSVRIERVQEITPAGCLAEGIRKRRLPVPGLPTMTYSAKEYPGADEPKANTPQEAYAALWNDLHAKPKAVYRTEKGKKILTRYESYPWDEKDRDPREEINGHPHYCAPNPYVWVEGIEKFKA